MNKKLGHDVKTESDPTFVIIMVNTNKEDKDLITKFIDSIHQEIADADAVLFREISPIGNSAHVIIPKEYIGKHARIIINSKNVEGKIEIRKCNQDKKTY